jgi:hypothetical protein
MEPEDNEPVDYNENSWLDSFISYLESSKGHQIAKDVLESYKEFQNKKLENHKTYSMDILKRRSFNYKFTLIVHAVILLTIIGVASFLTANDKFSSTLGVFFGTILGYVFSKQQSGK